MAPGSRTSTASDMLSRALGRVLTSKASIQRSTETGASVIGVMRPGTPTPAYVAAICNASSESGPTCEC